MQDRLSELNDGILGRKDSEASGDDARGSKHKNDEDLEMQGSDDITEQFMSEFFEEVNKIKQWMSNIRRNINQIEEVSKQALVEVGLDQGPKTSDELDKLINDTNMDAADIRNKLKDMDENNKAMMKDKKMQGSAQLRIRMNMHSTLTRKFLDLMTEYQSVQTKYKNKYKERVERQYKIAKPDATQQEIDEALESGDTEVFAKVVLQDKRHAMAKDALQYIENRHRDILRLEASILELHQLFLDMAVLVEAQGELIDQIEFNVSQSVAYTKQGVKSLRDANKYQKKSRKKMCIIIIILVVVFAFLIAGGLGLILGLIKK